MYPVEQRREVKLASGEVSELYFVKHGINNVIFFQTALGYDIVYIHVAERG